jgi:hypothetical protein
MSGHRRYVKGCCERCGLGTGVSPGPSGVMVANLQVHHRDRDRSNNDPSNLETLCARCHTLEHNEQRRETKRNMVYLRLSSSDRARWDAAAEERGVGLSQLIRGAVEDLLALPPPLVLAQPSAGEVADLGRRNASRSGEAAFRGFSPDFKKGGKR